MQQIIKYPRTSHLQGSKLQKGDEDLSQISFSDLLGKHLIIEEKCDGANCGISFSDDCELQLQSRGHYLIGGPREKHWTLFKQWANHHRDRLFDILSNRYIMFLENCFAKHTIFYDLLPHYFLEFDIYDREQDAYLSTDARRGLLGSSPVRSVFVLHEGTIDGLDELVSLVRPSYHKSGRWRARLMEQALRAGVEPELAARQTDASDDMEGLYIKVEAEGIVQQRLKWVRHSFLNAITDSETHWLDRPIIQNLLAPGVDIFRS